MLYSQLPILLVCAKRFLRMSAAISQYLTDLYIEVMTDIEEYVIQNPSNPSC